MIAKRRWGLLIDCAIMTTFVLVCMVVAEQFDDEKPSNWIAPSENWTLGAENNSIAKAIYAGRGFGDPFQTQSGPTAWMPPVYPYLLAFLYWLTDFQPDTVVEIVLGLKALSIVVTGMLVIHVARMRRIAWLGYVGVSLGLMANFHDFFQSTHDVWILVLLVDLIFLGSISYWNTARSFLRSASWGFLGGLCALCSPVVGGAWAACVLTSTLVSLRGLRRQINPRYFQHPIQSVLVVAFAAIITITPWTIRNRLVLDKWIPIKSNSGFEIWQSLCIDPDGVLDEQVLRQHPWPNDGTERAEYLNLGEVKFVEKKWPTVFEALRDSPWTAAIKLRNRAIAALVYYFAYRDLDEKMFWSMLFKRVVFPIPFVAFLVCIGFAEVRNAPEFKYAAVLYVTMLSPYILISYYDRYAAPLLPMKLLLVIFAASACVQIFRRSAALP